MIIWHIPIYSCHFVSTTLSWTTWLKSSRKAKAENHYISLSFFQKPDPVFNNLNEIITGGQGCMLCLYPCHFFKNPTTLSWTIWLKSSRTAKAACNCYISLSCFSKTRPCLEQLDWKGITLTCLEQLDWNHHGKARLHVMFISLSFFQQPDDPVLNNLIQIITDCEGCMYVYIPIIFFKNQTTLSWTTWFKSSRTAKAACMFIIIYPGVFFTNPTLRTTWLKSSRTAKVQKPDLSWTIWLNSSRYEYIILSFFFLQKTCLP